MYQVVGYHRPSTVGEALDLLAADDRVALAGGVHVHHDGGGVPTEVVDLQEVGLDTVELDGATARLGATVRLQAVVDDERLPDAIRQAARAEQPSTLRTLATIGGAIATASGASVLLAALLAHGAVVRMQSATSGERRMALSELLSEGCHPTDLILDVSIETAGRASIVRTGRTPEDVPIVGVVGRRSADTTAIAVCGVEPVPTLVGPGGIDALQPVDDHRASASYRRHLAEVLTARVLEELS